MSEGEGAVSTTIGEAKRHPYWIVGGIVCVVLLLWIVGRNKSPAANTQAFTFSYGPSDAQVKAGTALAIGQAADQTAVSLANINATSQAAIGQDYFGYLANNSANNLAATLNTNSTAATVDQTNAQYASATALGTAGYATQTALGTAQYANSTAVQVAQLQAQTAQKGQVIAGQVATQGYATQVTLGNDQYALGLAQSNAAVTQNASNNYTAGVIANINAGAAIAVNSTNANAANYQAGLASYTSTYNMTQQANIDYNNNVAGYSAIVNNPANQK